MEIPNTNARIVEVEVPVAGTLLCLRCGGSDIELVCYIDPKDGQAYMDCEPVYCRECCDRS